MSLLTLASVEARIIILSLSSAEGCSSHLVQNVTLFHMFFTGCRVISRFGRGHVYGQYPSPIIYTQSLVLFSLRLSICLAFFCFVQVAMNFLQDELAPLSLLFISFFPPFILPDLLGAVIWNEVADLRDTELSTKVSHLLELQLSSSAPITVGMYPQAQHRWRSQAHCKLRVSYILVQPLHVALYLMFLAKSSAQRNRVHRA